MSDAAKDSWPTCDDGMDSDIRKRRGKKKKKRKNKTLRIVKSIGSRGVKRVKKKMKNSTKKETPSDITTLSYGFD